jgi:hypothetical protein
VRLTTILSGSLLACNLFPMPACPRCSKRPAKRSCPAVRTKICAVCCARERMIELACPESCSYLIEARTNSSQREMALRRKEAADSPSDLTLNEQGLVSLDAIERAIVNAQRGIGGAAFRGLDDSEILAAVENTIKNIETEESGLIYEHRAAAPRIDELARRIRAGLDEIGNDLPADARPRRSDIFKALSFTRESVKVHMQRAAEGGAASRSFIRHISLFYPWPQEATTPLII